MSTHLAHNASVGPVVVPVGIDIVVLEPGTSIAGSVEVVAVVVARVIANAEGYVAVCNCIPLEQSDSCCGTVITRRESHGPRGH